MEFWHLSLLEYLTVPTGLRVSISIYRFHRVPIRSHMSHRVFIIIYKSYQLLFLLSNLYDYIIHYFVKWKDGMWTKIPR